MNRSTTFSTALKYFSESPPDKLKLGDGSLLNDEALPEGFSRATFQLVVFIPLIVTAAIGVIFYVLGRPTREQPPDEAIIPSKPAAISDQ